jgi:transcriptional regulator with XRE-family HTH domain
MTTPTNTAPPLAQQIGARIRQARLQRVITQEELAQSIGIERSTLAKYERGQRSMNAEVLVQIARLLNVPASRLLGEQLPVEMVRDPEIDRLEDVQAVVRILDQRPDWVPQVRALLEVLTEREGLDAGADHG